MWSGSSSICKPTSELEMAQGMHMDTCLEKAVDRPNQPGYRRSTEVAAVKEGSVETPCPVYGSTWRRLAGLKTSSVVYPSNAGF